MSGEALSSRLVEIPKHLGSNRA